MKKVRHVGLRPERVARVTPTNGLERAFALAWREINKTDRRGLSGPQPILKCLLANAWAHQYGLGLHTEQAIVTQHDATVVATVVQWLGTQIGSGFLADVLRTPAGQKFLRTELGLEPKQKRRRRGRTARARAIAGSPGG